MHNQDQNNTYEAGKVIAALNENPALEYDIDAALDGIDYEKVELIFRSNKEEKSNTGDLLLIYLNDKEKSAVFDAIETLLSNPYILYAEPDYIEELHLMPNDPLYRQLWGTRKIEASSAWNYTVGSNEVAVGVIDTGVDYRHPDIRENMWVSPDGRLANGWNFADNNRNPMDLDGHGTHVAGTIGAVGNNHIGVTGICWDVKVVALKFGLDIASAIAAINFANQYDIPILNSSWGGRVYSPALKHAVEQYHGLFIASAGNNGENNDEYPVYPTSFDCDNLISVAATNPDDELTRFSNYGVETVDLAAPGIDILSLSLDDEYSGQNGTSMSAPHVAGAAALLKSYIPDISVSALKYIILASVVKRRSLAGKITTEGVLNVNDMFQLATEMIDNGNIL